MLVADESDTSRHVVEFLRKSSTYPNLRGSVQFIETHISWVFLVDKFVYKLKKPVRLEFLDFSTSELRRQACEDEVRLNRRLCHDVYLGTQPIMRNTQGELSLNGVGEAIDWVVRMRRLPEYKAFDRLLLTGRLQAEDEKVICQCLIAFFTQLIPESVKPDDYRRNLVNHIRANERDLSGRVPSCDLARLHRILGNQLRYLHVEAPLFDARVAGGHIVDGHGDLRPEHIYVESLPSIIDCIEFSTELRRNDVADELSFLAMECDRIGHGEVGKRIIAAYEAASSDTLPSSLLAFYKSYRALVRAKVALLRLEQGAEESRRPLARQVHQYLDWADHHATQLGRPSVVVVGGLMGTGKSTLAKELATLTGAELLATDSIRRTMFGVSHVPAGYGEKMYQPENRSRVYEVLFSQAAALLDWGSSVVLDGTFSSAQQQRQAISLSQRHGAVPLFVLCQCPKPKVLSRIATRAAANTSNSEARVDLYDRQAAEFETRSSDLPCLNVDTTTQLAQQSQAVFQELRRVLGE